jgi:hypothetical protein
VYIYNTLSVPVNERVLIFIVPQEKNETRAINVTSWVSMDTGDKLGLLFQTPINRSFLCKNVDDLLLSSNLHYSFPDFPDDGIKLKNDSIVAIASVRFDAFRPRDAPHKNFQVAMDCDYQPNDIVPIVVGVALAALVVFVIIAYIVGRRRNRQSGYQSM